MTFARVTCACVLFFFALVAFTNADEVLESDAKPVISSLLVDTINNDPGTKWSASLNNRFKDVTMGEAKKMMGFKPTVPWREEAKILMKSEDASVGAIPTSFDSRTHWPGCVGPILDQGQCGSCWAFGATESLQDRFCTKARQRVDLSEQQVVSCVNGGLEGCNGGEPLSAFLYMSLAGVVGEACVPYTSGKTKETGWCPWSCTNSSAQWVKHYSQTTSIRYHNTVEAIQTAIMNDGPVEACFQVYQDFMTYTSGVYSHKTGSYLGGHCIKVIGWGVVSNQPYWICANSWSTAWGMDGHFLIARGVNECGIEGEVWEALPSA